MCALKLRIPQKRQRAILRALIDPMFAALDSAPQGRNEAEYARRLLNGALCGAGGVDQNPEGIG